MLIREQLNINFTANLNRAEEANMFFVLEEAKETVLDFSQGNALKNNLIFNLI